MSKPYGQLQVDLEAKVESTFYDVEMRKIHLRLEELEFKFKNLKAQVSEEYLLQEKRMMSIRSEVKPYNQEQTDV